MKRLYVFIIALLFGSECSFALKHVDLYRSGVFFKSYGTIDSAIKAAYVVGDSLVLSADTFFESNLDAHTKVIQYQGTISGGDTTIIDGGGALATIIKLGRSGTIRDIIFQNSNDRALIISSGFVTDTFRIEGNSIIRNMTSTNWGTYTIEANCQVFILMDNTKIINNTTMRMMVSNNLIIKDNVLISNNHITMPYFRLAQLGTIEAPRGILSISGKVKIINNTADSSTTAGICIINQTSSSVFIGDSVTISGNRVLTPGYGKGGAIYFGKNAGFTSSSSKSFTFGALNLSNSSADEGGAVYCDDSTINLVFNGTNFSNNSAKHGGAIYTQGGLDVKNANFYNNQADSGAAIYLKTAMGGSSAPSISVYNSRIYNPIALSGKRQNEVYASYTPAMSIPPSISFSSNWWGRSDTIGVLKESLKGIADLSYWAVANWSVKGGVPVVSGDTSFPVAAAIKLNNGSAFAASSFTMLKGIFKTDTGSFAPPIAAINSSNIVSSTYKTFKDSALTRRNAHFVASIDADTFRVTVLVWSNDTLPTKGAIREQAPTQVLVYPNPTSELLHIQAIEIGCSIALFDVNGKLVKQVDANSNQMSIDIKDLATGLYQLKIAYKDGRVGTAQVMKE